MRDAMTQNNRPKIIEIMKLRNEISNKINSEKAKIEQVRDVSLPDSLKDKYVQFKDHTCGSLDNYLLYKLSNIKDGTPLTHPITREPIWCQDELEFGGYILLTWIKTYQSGRNLIEDIMIVHNIRFSDIIKPVNDFNNDMNNLPIYFKLFFMPIIGASFLMKHNIDKKEIIDFYAVNLMMFGLLCYAIHKDLVNYRELSFTNLYPLEKITSTDIEDYINRRFDINKFDKEKYLVDTLLKYIHLNFQEKHPSHLNLYNTFMICQKYYSNIGKINPPCYIPDPSYSSFTTDDLIYCDFKDQDLSGRNLSYSKLSGANLEEANFTDTVLISADLTNTNLQGANFTNSILKNTDLSGSNLKGANFTNTNLENAILKDTILLGVSGRLREGPSILPENWTYNYNFLFGPGANLSYQEIIVEDLEEHVIDLSDLNLQGSNFLKQSF